MIQTMLAEIRQLRLDIQTGAATIQRVQIGCFGCKRRAHSSHEPRNV